MKRKRFEYWGIAVVLGVYLLIALILFAERTGIQYDAAQRVLDYLPNEQVVLTQDAYAGQNTECLVLTDSRQRASVQAQEQFRQIFLDMKVGCEWVDIEAQEIPDLQEFRTVVLLIDDLSPLGEWVLSLSDWVYQGGRAFLALPPIKDGIFTLLEQKLGIIESGYDYEFVDSVCFSEDFLMGSDRIWPLEFGYDSSLRVLLRSDTTLYAWEGDQNACPLIWKAAYGQGCFVVNNLGHISKGFRGILAACYSVLEDAFAYPVINGSAFYLDDFPAPVPGGYNERIREEYHMSISEFYSNVWLPDMIGLAEEYGIRYTCVVIETYDDDTSGIVTAPDDNASYRYFGDLMQKYEAEIGLHGYNHQPLSLTNVNYGDDLPYDTWPSLQAMENALNELLRFVSELTPETESLVYVPPSNVLSPEGRNLLATRFPQVRTIASLYLPGLFAYEQEFCVSADGMVEQPRIISGSLLNETNYLNALSELNMHFVNTHFMHPDDMLDEERNGNLNWSVHRDILDRYMNWLYSSAPFLRNLTGSELSGAIQRYGNLTVHRTPFENGLQLTLDHFVNEAHFLFRLEEGINPVAEGGTLTKITESLYLLSADSQIITITWGR